MATSYDILDKNVAGKHRVHHISCTVDAASANIDTGLAFIIGHSLGVISMTTAGITMKKNIGSGATARNGILNINSAVSGDVFHLVVYGR
jgi:hypothetical protein